jgi:hypothetical protein
MRYILNKEKLLVNLVRPDFNLKTNVVRTAKGAILTID